MNVKHLLIALLLAGPIVCGAEIRIDKNEIGVERDGGALTVSIPLRNGDESQRVGNMTVTLLDEAYRPLARVEKKVILLNGKRTETVALPVSDSTPDIEQCLVRIDFQGHTWLKRFTTTQAGQEIHIIGQKEWLAGSQASMRVIVTKSKGGDPIENATIEISTTPKDGGKAYFHSETKSDGNGTASFRFKIPQSLTGQRLVTIRVESEYGKDTIESPVEIESGVKIFLIADKPVYQPGQLMHLRALAAHRSTDEPIPSRETVLEVYDGKGNKVFKKNITTSEFGIVSADFQLADEVNQGDYTIKALLDDDSTEKTVQVYEYVLPKFKVTVKNEKKFYAPGDTVTGSVDARYFFGKAVAGSKVKVIANCFDVGFHEFATVEGKTDEEGHYEYEFTVPEKLVGQPSFKGNTIVQMDVRVLDTADHEEQKIHTFHVATESLQIEVIPESGTLVPGVENEVYLVASYPDGSVAKPKLRVDSKYFVAHKDVTCDENGIATIVLTPSDSIQNFEESPVIQNVMNVPRPKIPLLLIDAELDEDKVQIVRDDFELDSADHALLLRLDKGVYTMGQTMKVTALSPSYRSETVFLDAVKNGQTVLTKTLQLEDGLAELSLPLDNQLTGSLALHAYIIRPDGNMIRDTRQAIVTRSDDLRIEIVPNQLQYEPGESAQLRISVTGSDGKPVRAALGMHVVDESVYSLTEKEPGLAKVFFAIEKELLEPKVEIHGFHLDKVVRLSSKRYEENAQLSKALLSKLDTHTDFALNIKTGEERVQLARNDLNRIRSVMSLKTIPVSRQPRDVEELLLSFGDDPVGIPSLDPWGEPYQIVFADENVFLNSKGRDGQTGTGDDIRIPNYAGGFIISASDSIGSGDKVGFVDNSKSQWGFFSNYNAYTIPQQQITQYGIAQKQFAESKNNRYFYYSRTSETRRLERGMKKAEATANQWQEIDPSQMNQSWYRDRGRGSLGRRRGGVNLNFGRPNQGDVRQLRMLGYAGPGGQPVDHGVRLDRDGDGAVDQFGAFAGAGFGIGGMSGGEVGGMGLMGGMGGMGMAGEGENVVNFNQLRNIDIQGIQDQPQDGNIDSRPDIPNIVYSSAKPISSKMYSEELTTPVISGPPGVDSKVGDTNSLQLSLDKLPEGVAPVGDLNDAQIYLYTTIGEGLNEKMDVSELTTLPDNFSIFDVDTEDKREINQVGIKLGDVKLGETAFQLSDDLAVKLKEENLPDFVASELLLSLDDSDEEAPATPLVVDGKVDEKQLRQLLTERLPSLSDSELALNLDTEDLKRSLIELSAKRPLETKKRKAVRVRRFFPETLFYTPELITDDQGQIALNLPGADSITTWRMSAMANTKSGAIGDATSALKVFKPFFVDLDLPIALIQNDEVTIPVAVYNYLPAAQTVDVKLEPGGWYELIEGTHERNVSIAANEVTSVTYRIRARQLGHNPITVFAYGSQDNDAIGRSIEVRPNGAARFVNCNGRLSGSVQDTVTFPEGRIDGADRLFVKIYPGVFSQVVEGFDAILRMPNGCFEQTSSTTYPNILALDYMKRTGHVTPAIEMKAREYINLGYQRLLTFEIDGGGFQVFGKPAATRILSAYGLMEFMDMSRVYTVDAKVLERTKAWLLSQMKDDGSWEPDKHYSHAEMWKSIQDNDLLSTAYIALALAKADAGPQMEKTKRYLFQHADEAEDSYTLAILCNTLLTLAPGDSAAKGCVNRLVDLATVEGELMYWESDASMSFARGNHASVETTAWAVLALIEDGRYASETGKALNWIIQQKDPNGTWGTTHGTVLALKALIESLGKRTEEADATILVHVNGKDAAKLTVTPDNSDVFRQIDVTPFIQEGGNRIVIDLEGKGSLLYQVTGKYFVPWKDGGIGERTTDLPGGSQFSIDVQYDRSELRRNDTVTCHVTARNHQGSRAEMVMIDVGVPPGFRVERSAMDDLLEEESIAKYTIMPRQLLIYLESMNGGEAIELAVPMKATLPMTAKAPESTIYEYYNPQNKNVAPPMDLRVN